MLKRRKRIAKYISALQKKKLKLSTADVDKLKLEQPQQENHQAPSTIKTHKNGVSIPKLKFQNNTTNEELSMQEQHLWHDSEDQQINLPKKNMFKKLELNDEPTEQQYEGRLKKFYESKYGVKNWAVEGQGQYEFTVKEMLDQEDIYVQSKGKMQRFSIDFIGRTTEKHESIVTGIDFKGNVVASCGLDQKLKIWSLRSQESNPELRVKLQKDIYAQKYALNGCFFRQSEVILSTLRKNYLIVDTQKWKIKYIGSSFLNDHKTFQNMRANKNRSQILMFSQNKISLIDDKNTYLGSLLANQQLVDVQLGDKYDIFGISNDVVYQWDIRIWRLIKSQRQCLGFTKLWNNGYKLGIGSKLGIVRLYNIEGQNKEYAEINSLVTHVTDLKGNRDGSLLLEASKWKPNAIRLIDTNRGKCIGGWPTTATKVGLPTATNFSSSEFAVGNSHGYLSFFGLESEKK